MGMCVCVVLPPIMNDDMGKNKEEELTRESQTVLVWFSGMRFVHEVLGE